MSKVSQNTGEQTQTGFVSTRASYQNRENSQNQNLSIFFVASSTIYLQNNKFKRTLKTTQENENKNGNKKV